MNSEELRKMHMEEGLRRSEIAVDPFIQFKRWYEEVLDSDLPEPTAMILATVDKNNQPWQRTVLLKLYDEDGFVFFTNYSSRKAAHIENNNKVSLIFPWHSLGRQLKITGHAEKIPTQESLKYFLTRPRGSQLGAWASHQSKVIKNRALLDNLYNEIKEKFHHGEIPLPSFWGGYRIRPETFEFWQARDSRMHDRFFFSHTEENKSDWNLERLAP